MWDYITLSLELIAAITASIYYLKYNRSFLKYILPYLWYVAILEISVKYYLNDVLKYTDVFYNVRQILLFILTYWLLINCIKNRKRLLIIHILFGVYGVTQIIDIITKNFLTDYLPLSYFTGGFVSLLGIMYYAIELLKSHDITPLRKDLTVWFLMANLVFWIGYLPIYVIFNNYTYFNSEVINSLVIIRNIFIVLLNVIIILGFIWSNPNSKNTEIQH